MTKTILLLGLLLVFNSVNQSQVDSSRSDGRVRPDIPTVYLDYICQNQQSVFLRLVNNTSWHISVSSGLYFPTKKPITLLNGVKTYAAPNDEPIESLFYRLEVDEGSGISNIRIPKSARRGVGNDGGGAWVTPSDSMFFPVPIDYLRQGLKVVVNFKYEWEIPKDGHRIDDPEHRVYFRARSFSNKMPLACK